MMYKVKDHKHRIFRFKGGSLLVSCGSDGENISGIDFVNDGKVKYCIALEDEPVRNILAKLFEEVTNEPENV